MALLKGKPVDIPKDAVVLTRNEALTYQLKIIESWKYPMDVIAFKHGGGVLAVCSSLVGMYVNNHYRRKFKLGTIGRITSYLPIVCLPAALSFIMHTELVLPDVILGSECPVCLEMRASALQATLGCIFPTILAPFSSMSLAVQYGTYDVPYVLKEPKKAFQMYKKLTKPIANLLFAIFVGQALIGSAVTYLEGQSVRTVNSKLAKLEFELEQAGQLQ